MNSSHDFLETTIPQNEPRPEEELQPTVSVGMELEGNDRGGVMEKWSSAFAEFEKALNALATPEEKIVHGLSYMRETISQEGSPRFREFWESRRIVLPLFKENVNAAIRSKLWNEHVELTVEARRLKEILEEQSAFAVEQIDLAIGAVEKDLVNLEAVLKQSTPIQFPGLPQSIGSREEFYQGLQQELSIFNALASRLNGLRKEIMKTDMRIRFKTKLFKRLSELGDQVFPKRKKLIEQVSTEFEKDVEAFVVNHFKGEEVVGAPYYALREEIKSFQWMAKALTLSSSVFSRTRLRMSECWDLIKGLEREYKKVQMEKKMASSDALQAIQAKVTELKEKGPSLTLRDLDREIDVVYGEMRNVYLDRDDIRYLRDSLANIRAPHIAAQEKKAQELEEAEKEKIRLKRERIALMKEKVQELVQKGAQLDLDTLLLQWKALEAEISSLEFSKMEKQQLERQLRPVKDVIADKKEHSLLNLSDDDRKTLENFRTVLQQKKERRQEIKEIVDGYRKTLGTSGLDFEKAFHLQELLDQEKERLDKANLAIEEIEQKIAGLER